MNPRDIEEAVDYARSLTVTLNILFRQRPTNRVLHLQHDAEHILRTLIEIQKEVTA